MDDELTNWGFAVTFKEYHTGANIRPLQVCNAAYQYIAGLSDDDIELLLELQFMAIFRID